jgi:hypothetical protein
VPPTISVSSEGIGSDAIFTVSGSGFAPNSTVTIRVFRLPEFVDQYFQQSATSSGQLNFRTSFPCTSSQQLRFTATDNRRDPSNLTGVLSSNTVVTSCP